MNKHSYLRIYLFLFFGIVLLAGISAFFIVTSDIAANGASSGTASIIRVASGELVVHSNGTMETKNNGRVEILSGEEESPPIAEASDSTIPVTIEMSPSQEPAAPMSDGSTPPTTIVRIASGGLVIHANGQMETKNGGQLEFLLNENSHDQTEDELPEIFADVTITDGQSGSNKAIGENPTTMSPCYTASTGNISIGSTTYQRTVWYCVNGYGNETVSTIKIQNTGSVDTPRLDRVTLSAVGSFLYSAQYYGPWIIGPGAALTLHPYHEIHSGWSNDAKVSDHWQSHTVTSILPD